MTLPLTASADQVELANAVASYSVVPDGYHGQT